MKSCTIIISHYESPQFLRTCIGQIKKHINPQIAQRIIISDQSKKETLNAITKEYLNDLDILIVNTKPLYSGYGMDWIIRNIDIQTDYICQLHVDAFPISNKWLYAPITLMEEYDFKFTGLLQFISNGQELIYPPNKGIFAMAQCFNIGKTDVYKEMSLQAGFTRFHNRKDLEMLWLNKDWDEWAKEDYNSRGSDDDVPAFFWEDKYREHNKMSWGLTGRIGTPGIESGYGTIIEDMVFHFGFHREGLGVMPQMGEKYRKWSRRINENYSGELIEEMLTEARKQKLEPADMRKIWDGTNKIASLATHSINKRIEELK